MSAGGGGEKHCCIRRFFLTSSVPVSLTILGSGSSGNCSFLETGQTRLLVDAGFSPRQIKKRLETIGRKVEDLHGILVTHEHSDHVQGLAGLSQKLGIPVYCNRLTRDTIEFQLKGAIPCRQFETGASFEVGDVLVETFSVPHDAQDPVGFMVRTTAGNFGFLTDLGHTTKLVIERVRAAHVLVLEANHDVKMLQECPHRPWSLKQRILSRHGHLSNEAAADAAEQVMSADLKHLYLGHLSRQCNRPELAKKVVQSRLDGIGARHVSLSVTSQELPSATLTL